MIRVFAAASGAVLVLVAGTACGGSSSGGSGSPSPSSPSPAASGLSSICQRLAADLEGLSTVTQQAGNSPKKLEAALKAQAEKLKSDAAAGPPKLQDGVNKLAQIIDAAAIALGNKQTPNLTKFQGKLQTAEAELSQACPSVSPQASPSG